MACLAAVHSVADKAATIHCIKLITGGCWWLWHTFGMCDERHRLQNAGLCSSGV
jgi:hypothetical protein